jgi:hypothetical protein
MRYLAFFFLCVLTGCIGHSMGQKPEQPAATFSEIYTGVFTGKSRDAVIAHYGSPSSTAKLDKALKVLEYKSRVRTVSESGHRDWDRCTTRFWLAENRVIRVDAIGDTSACTHFMKTRKREAEDDRRDWLRPEYP